MTSKTIRKSSIGTTYFVATDFNPLDKETINNVATEFIPLKIERNGRKKKKPSIIWIGTLNHHAR
ncbi:MULTISPECIES: hypothetical protein [Flavobacterium]|uniref:hypothetical protein n=1 Tax=Flavobacterium TaxID=237 RepID=UPI0012DC97BB|nr:MULTISPECIES: hypothetical protein [Flavobacterium]